MPTDKIRALDMRLIDDLFGMGGGYVLDFSDRTSLIGDRCMDR
jgi:hypothetical protein